MIIHKNQILEEQSGFVKGYFPSNEKLESVETLPAPVWTGQRMPYHTWQQIVSFFREVYKMHKAEATVRLYYDPKDGAWHVGVMDQVVSGSSAREEGSPPSLPGIEIGTIHSHASMTAFQSGTDHADEKAGFHITIGKLDGGVLDLHSRYVRQGLQYPVVLSDWIEVPDLAPIAGMSETVMKELNAVLFKNYMTAPADVAIPPEWIGKVKTYSYTGGSHYTLQPNGSYALNSWNGYSSRWDDVDKRIMRVSGQAARDLEDKKTVKETDYHRLRGDAEWYRAFETLEDTLRDILFTVESSDYETNANDTLTVCRDIDEIFEELRDEVATIFVKKKEADEEQAMVKESLLDSSGTVDPF